MRSSDKVVTAASRTRMLGEPKGAGMSGSVTVATTAFSRAAALSPSKTSISATGWFSTVVHSVICAEWTPSTLCSQPFSFPGSES